MIHMEVRFSFIDNLVFWGLIASKIYNVHNSEYISYVLSFLGIVIFFLSQNFFSIFKIQNINLKGLFRVKQNLDSKKNIKKRTNNKKQNN